MSREMITKGQGKQDDQKTPEPMKVEVSLKFRFGDAPEEKVTAMDQQEVLMNGSVVDNRERIMRSFIGHLLREGLKQPNVLREIVPGMRFFGARK